MPRFACARVLSVCFIIHSVHVAFARSFAFINICRKVDKRTEEKDKNAISPDDKHFGCYQRAICDSQFAKPLIFLQLYCFKWFSGGTFQSIYFFPTITIRSTTSIRQAYELILLCHGKASNVQKEYTKIYKQPSEETNTHAQ